MHREKHSEEKVDEAVTAVEETVAETVVEESVADAEAAPEAATLSRKINIKLALVIAFVIIVLAVLYSARGLFVAAMVNGAPISRMAIMSQLEKASGKQMLEALVVKKLIAQEAAKTGKVVTDEMISTEMKKLEDQVTAAGNSTLDELLAGQGMTRADLRDQIMVQKQLELILGDKVVVTDKEVEEYITQNKLTIPKEQLEAAHAEIREQMKQQKMSTEGKQLVEKLRTDASISYFVKY